MLSILQQIHGRHIIHRDMKPDNFLFHPETLDLYLVDFGLAKSFTDKKGLHNPVSNNAAFRGTYKFCSVNTHKGLEQSRRDDLESLCYVLIYIQKGSQDEQSLIFRVPSLENFKRKFRASFVSERLDRHHGTLLGFAPRFSASLELC